MWQRLSNEITLQALEWNPPGKRNRGRPRNMWQCTVEKELAEIGKMWKEAKREAANRIRWRGNVEALCSIWSKEE
jgi:hypothetical protein